MQEQKWDELQDRSLDRLDVAEVIENGRRDLIRKLEAQSIIHSEIEAMKRDGKALSLTDEELELLRAFRQFKLRMRRNGEVFRRQTQMPDGVQVVDETAEILHPFEIAE